jgi:uncharacterized protein (DUF433 family)
MAASISLLKGIIHGKTIELDMEPGLPDGQPVTVAIQRIEESAPSQMPNVETWCDRIVFDSAVSPTEKVVKGTRLQAEALVAELQQGSSDEDFLKCHPELTIDDLAALRNYARSPLGLRRAFGGWAEDAEELDRYLAWIRENRTSRRREIEE